MKLIKFLRQNTVKLVGNLIHMTDTTTNNKYNCDIYFFGVEFDISLYLHLINLKILLNLADRIYKIKMGQLL
jgi:hypothetical protein